MKLRKLLIIALLLLSQKGLSQYFNHEISRYYFSNYTTQTITPNRLNQIVFLSVNQSSPNYPNDIELVKLDQSGNYLLSKRIFDSYGTYNGSS